LGTHRDAIRKRNDKQHTVRGEQHGRSKLTEIEVQEIRTLTLDLTAEKTAEVFNVSRSTISQVRRRETWRHIP
jgi:DNA-binding transcriptional regulator YiaG